MTDSEQSESVAALAKAADMFPDGIEALVITRQEDGLHTLEANLGWGDETLAEDLQWHIATGIAHALDAAYECGVYWDGSRI